MACGEPIEHQIRDIVNSSASGLLTTGSTLGKWDIGRASCPGTSSDIWRSVSYVQHEETKQMALYRVYLVHIATRKIIEQTVVATCETNAYLKAVFGTGINVDDIDDYDKYAECIFVLSDDDES